MDAKTINHYLQFVTKSVDKYTGAIIFTSLDGRFQIVVRKCTHNLKSKNDLMNLWKKHGYIKKTMPTSITIETYFTDDNNNCVGRYNITCKFSEDKKFVLNFDYLREWNEDNIKELVAECVRLREMDIRY